MRHRVLVGFPSDRFRGRGPSPKPTDGEKEMENADSASSGERAVPKHQEHQRKHWEYQRNSSRKCCKGGKTTETGSHFEQKVCLKPEFCEAGGLPNLADSAKYEVCEALRFALHEVGFCLLAEDLRLRPRFQITTSDISNRAK